jgi:hypothetical protein
MILEILLVFLFLSITSSLIYLTGRLFLSVFNYRSDNLNLFHALIAGLLFWVLVPSLIITKGLTIHLFFIPLIFLFFLAIKKEIQLKYFDWKWKQVLLDVSKILIFLIPIYLFAVIQFYDFKSEFIYADLHHDFHAYAKHSQFLILTGNENYYREVNYFFNEKMSGLTPYHYFELWLNGIISWVFNISNLKGIILVTFPLLQTIASIGIYELIKKHIQIQQINFFFVLTFLFALVFIQPIYFWFYDHFELLKFNEGMVNTSVFSFGRKYGGIFIFSILSLDFFIDGKQKIGIVSLASLSILSIGILPGITFGIPFACLVLFLWDKKNVEFLKWSLVPLVLGIVILLFYKIFAIEETKNLINGKSLFSNILMDGLTFQYLKSFLFNTTFPFLRLMIGIGIYILIFLFVYKKSKIYNKNDLIILAIIISVVILVADCAAGMAYGLPDNGQLLNNAIPLLNAFLIITFILLLRNHDKKILIITILTMIAGYNLMNNLIYNELMNSYQRSSTPIISDNFKNTCYNNLNSKINPKIGFISKKDSLNPYLDFYTSPLMYFDFVDVNPVYLNLSLPKYYKNENYYGTYRFHQPMYHYKESLNLMSDINNQFKFIDEFKIDFLLSDYIIEQDKNKHLFLLTQDRNSGFYFYKLMK